MMIEGKEVSSNGKGNLGVTLGAIGTGLGVLQNGLGGILGNSNDNQSKYVSQEVYDVQLKLIEAQKDNAILSADLNSEKKMVEVFNAANDKIMAVREELSREIRDLDKRVDSNAAAQAVINCGFSSADAVLQTQVALLMGLTKTGIPNSSLCPGYGNVTITPSTTTTT